MKYTKEERTELRKDQKALNTLLEKYGKDDIMEYLNKLDEDLNNSYLSDNLSKSVIDLMKV